jgi:hypothetical protein
MGIFGLGFGKRASNLLAGTTDLGIVSTWAPEADLAPLVIADALGLDAANLPLTRAAAIKIPAVSKARNLLVSTIAPKPLVALNAAGPLDAKAQPTFLYRTDSNVTPYERMAWTVDDLIFYGYSLWRVVRGAGDSPKGGPILSAEYVPFTTWRIRAGVLYIDDERIDDLSSVLLFNSPFEGLLSIGATTLKGARDTEASWVGRARNPIPLIELHVTDEAELGEEEIKAFVNAWSTARRSENGAIGYTPAGLEIRTHGEVKADLMVEGRNSIRTDVGSFLNIRASMLDGTMGIDSLTYTTTEGEKNSFYEFDLPFWTDPITHRLSMDDVVPRGQRVRFDMYDAYHLPLDTGTPTED